MKIKSISPLHLLFITISMLACSSSSSNPADKEKKQPEETLQKEETPAKENTPQKEKAMQKIEVVASGNQCAIEKPKQVVVKNQAEFDKLWLETFKGTDMAPAKPAVNFNEKWVIAAHLGMISNGGHSIAVTEIKTDAAGNTVMLKHSKPGQGCVSSMAIEFPYVIVSFDHLSSDKIEFRTTVEEKKCE